MRCAVSCRIAQSPASASKGSGRSEKENAQSRPLAMHQQLFDETARLVKPAPEDGPAQATVRFGLAALRSWFFDTVQRSEDPRDVTNTGFELPETELLDRMDVRPPGHDEMMPEDAMSIFSLYETFVADCDRARERWREMRASEARVALRLGDVEIKPPINPGVRFFCHLSRALKDPSLTTICRSESDPSITVPYKLDPSKLSHVLPPGVFNSEPTPEHLQMWCDPSTGQVDLTKLSNDIDMHYKLAKAMADAFPGPDVTLGFICPVCQCGDPVNGELSDLTQTLSTYMRGLVAIECSHCGVYFSALHPAIEAYFTGIRPRDEGRDEDDSKARPSTRNKQPKNARCACGSGKKFKKCCDRVGVQ